MLGAPQDGALHPRGQLESARPCPRSERDVRLVDLDDLCRDRRRRPFGPALLTADFHEIRQSVDDAIERRLGQLAPGHQGRDLPRVGPADRRPSPVRDSIDARCRDASLLAMARARAGASADTF